VFVTPQLDCIIVGLDWIQSKITNWNFPDQWVELRGLRVPVHVRPELAQCHRIVAAADVKIPPLSERDVEAYAVLPQLAVDKPGRATRATMLESGLIVAGTVLPNRAMDLTLRVMNPTGKPIQLQKGVRCNTEAVEVI